MVKIWRFIFVFLFCSFIQVSYISAAEGGEENTCDPKSETVEYEYVAEEEGCSYETNQRNCCQDGKWSEWNKPCDDKCQTNQCWNGTICEDKPQEGACFLALAGGSSGLLDMSVMGYANIYLEKSLPKYKNLLGRACSSWQCKEGYGWACVKYKEISPKLDNLRTVKTTHKESSVSSYVTTFIPPVNLNLTYDMNYRKFTKKNPNYCFGVFDYSGAPWDPCYDYSSAFCKKQTGCKDAVPVGRGIITQNDDYSDKIAGYYESTPMACSLSAEAKGLFKTFCGVPYIDTVKEWGYYRVKDKVEFYYGFCKPDSKVTITEKTGNIYYKDIKSNSL